MRSASSLWTVFLFLSAATLCACGGGGGGAGSGAIAASGTSGTLPAAGVAVNQTVSPTPSPAANAVASATALPAVQVAVKQKFLGAFFRSVGTVPYGVFSATATLTAPKPYPTAGTNLFGASGYCDQVAANGVSISSGYPVDATKLANVVNLGVKWTRSTVSTDSDDLSHMFGAGSFSFADLDSAQCALVRNGIEPVIGLEAGPVHYNLNPAVWAPVDLPTYQTAADFGTYCSAVATHEIKTFTSVYRYSRPGNEVNTNPQLFPGGVAQIAAYSKACYSAIKAVQPTSVVYGFELNMEYDVNAPAFVQQLYALGCKIGTCYDAISVHLYFPYPLPSDNTPCFPNSGGNYDMECLKDIRTAANSPTMHVLIGETAYLVTSTVPNEPTKATAIVALMNHVVGEAYVDGVNYANVDECALYPTGFFSGGCLVNVQGTRLPAYPALASWAMSQ